MEHLLAGMHTFAAQRGDGLLPELAKAMSRPPGPHYAVNTRLRECDNVRQMDFKVLSLSPYPSYSGETGNNIQPIAPSQE